jgi:hypothetical protein
VGHITCTVQDLDLAGDIRSISSILGSLRKLRILHWGSMRAAVRVVSQDTLLPSRLGTELDAANIQWCSTLFGIAKGFTQSVTPHAAAASYSERTGRYVKGIGLTGARLERILAQAGDRLSGLQSSPSRYRFMLTLTLWSIALLAHLLDKSEAREGGCDEDGVVLGEGSSSRGRYQEMVQPVFSELLESFRKSLDCALELADEQREGMGRVGTGRHQVGVKGDLEDDEEENVDEHNVIWQVLLVARAMGNAGMDSRDVVQLLCASSKLLLAANDVIGVSALVKLMQQHQFLDVEFLSLAMDVMMKSAQVTESKGPRAERMTMRYISMILNAMRCRFKPSQAVADILAERMTVIVEKGSIKVSHAQWLSKLCAVCTYAREE